MNRFVYTSSPARVLFGSGRTAELPAELARLSARHPFIVSTPGGAVQAEKLASLVGGRATVHPHAAMHTPVEVTEQALVRLDQLGADCLVAIGGGSPIGLSKALAVRTGMPQIVIPTTYAGSEVTDILGETSGGVKTTRRDPAILPEVVIYDVDHTLSLPPALSVASGLNAIAHACEALYAVDGNPIIALLAEEAISALAASLPLIARKPSDRGARKRAQYGAWLCGICLGSVSMALHHKLAHVLGGSFDLPHAETHAILLPYSLAYNAPAAPEAIARIARALGSADALTTQLRTLMADAGLPTSLAAIGMPREGVGRAVELALKASYPNPRPLERAPLTQALEAAIEGTPWNDCPDGAGGKYNGK